jgi:hypothetical protein
MQGVNGAYKLSKGFASFEVNALVDINTIVSFF